MTKYIVYFDGCSSEWLNCFIDLQQFMNDLKNKGILKNITVARFDDNKKTKSFTYNYIGECWQKTK